MNVAMKYNFAQITLTDVVLQASKKSKEFLVNALESEYAGAKNDLQRSLSRQAYGIGTGQLFQINGIGSTPTFDADNPMTSKDPTFYLQAGAHSIGTPLGFSSSATAIASGSYATCSAITDGDTFTVGADGGVADNDYVFMAHYDGDATPSITNLNSEIMGLKGLVDDQSFLTTLEGQSRATYLWWNSYVNSSSSQRSLTDALMHTTYLESIKYGSPNLGITHHDVYSAYGQLLTPDRRYTSEMKVKGGFVGTAFNNIPIVPDFDCPYDELYFLDTSTLSVEDLAPISFLNEDGSILDRSSTTPAWNATLRWYANLCNKDCNKSTALRDVIK